MKTRTVSSDIKREDLVVRYLLVGPRGVFMGVYNRKAVWTSECPPWIAVACTFPTIQSLAEMAAIVGEEEPGVDCVTIPLERVHGRAGFITTEELAAQYRVSSLPC